MCRGGVPAGPRASPRRPLDRHLPGRHRQPRSGQPDARAARATYRNEKGWVTDPGQQFPAGDLERSDIAWFIVSLEGRPAGVLRTLFDPLLLQYAKYGLKLIDPRVDVERFLRQHRIAEVGRFAVTAEHRGNVMLAAALMRAATQEMVARGYTHVITDVFDDDPHTMDAGAGGLLSRSARPEGGPNGGRAAPRPREAVMDGRSRMDERGPLDVPFLVFVIIVSVAVLALAIAVFPTPPA